MRIYPGTELRKIAITKGIIQQDDDLLKPVYYIAPGINYDTLRERAEATGRRWVFPDEDLGCMINRIREKKRRGSLWHHLKK